MRWIRARFNVLSEDDLIRLQGTRLPRKPCVLITFDDGYIDAYTRALPILCRYNIPAVFFIPYNFIEQRILGWWDLISHIVRYSGRRQIRVGSTPFDLQQNPSEAIQYCLARMTDRPPSENNRLISELCAACDVALPDTNELGAELMTWDHIRALIDHGMSIGSHTLSHRVLAHLSLAEQRKEIEGSKELLEEKTGARIRSLAYPVGGRDHYTTDTVSLARKAGYQLAFSFNTGTNRLYIRNPLEIARVTPDASYPVFTSSLVFPELFFGR
jgi:peptidoglycan/xylan/chitin deacetylase (PgdA/CDA1 family)